MSEINFYTEEKELLELTLALHLGIDGQLIERTEGVCGEIFIFDQGKNSFPRYTCAKVPKISKEISVQEAAQRFVQELRLQLSFYGHIFVHWAYDLTEVMGAPVALYRYYGNDLRKHILNDSGSNVGRLSTIAYVCAGLKHCYDAGLVAHQDLKPSNIFLHDIKEQFRDLPDLDIYEFPLVADFGLANASVDSGVFEGSRPYMAPEQWQQCELSSKTDVFALGVILCELLSRGYHPNGIILNDYWPQSSAGNSKKWTRPEPWKKWALSEKLIDETVRNRIDEDIVVFLEKMLSPSVSARPSIDEVLLEILSILKRRCTESYINVQFLIEYYSKKATSDSLNEQWPYLNDKWLEFEERFGSV